MCGRYRLSKEQALVARFFRVVVLPDWPWLPRYNIAPTSNVPIIRQQGAERQLCLARWGLVPFWSTGMPKFSTFNARSETVWSSPTYRKPIVSQRCLIPTDGFYEWQKVDDVAGRGAKLPHLFALPGDKLFAFAGVYDQWLTPEGGTLLSCSILTRGALLPVANIHSRSPVLVTFEDYGVWLDPKKSLKEVTPLFTSQLTLGLTMTPISDLINSARVDNADVVRPLTGT